MSRDPVPQPPAFQFYASDFIASTADMSPAEVGFYIRLLCFQWERGGVPGDAKVILRIGGSTGRSGYALWRSIKRKFECSPTDGLWRNARLERVRAQQAKRAALSRHAGKASGSGGRRKSDQNTPTESLPASDQNGNTPISSLQAPDSDLQSHVPNSNGTGTSPTTSCIEERTTGAAGSPSHGQQKFREENPVPVPPTVRDCTGTARAERDAADKPGGVEGINQRPRDADRVPAAGLNGGVERDASGGARTPEEAFYELIPVIADCTSAATPSAMGVRLRRVASKARMARMGTRR
jgi:uncharacterized protein YdaU (DUF1376 family)